MYGYVEICDPVEMQPHYCKSKVDGETLSFWSCVSPRPKNTKNVVLIHHGHGGGAETNYIRQLCHDLN